MTIIDYEMIETTPSGQWLRLELPFLTIERPTGRYTEKHKTLAYAKRFMTDLGFRMNIDFMFAPGYYDEKFTILLSPEIERYASWIALKWEPR